MWALLCDSSSLAGNNQAMPDWVTESGKNPYSLVRYLGTSKSCLEINPDGQVGRWGCFASLLCEQGNSSIPWWSMGKYRAEFGDQGAPQVSAWSSHGSVSISPSLKSFLRSHRRNQGTLESPELWWLLGNCAGGAQGPPSPGPPPQLPPHPWETLRQLMSDLK